MWISAFGSVLGYAAIFLPFAVLCAVLFSIFGSILVFIAEKDRPLGFILAIVYLFSLILTFIGSGLL